MTKHIDEEIINLMEEFDENKKGKYGKVGSIEHKIMKDVEKGIVTLEDETIEFEEKLILEDKVRILIPKEFNIMSDEVVGLKYSLEDKPDVIFTNEETTINIVLKCTDNILNDLSLREFQSGMINFLKETEPSIKIIERGIKYVSERSVGFFDFISWAPDGNIYNFIFFTHLQNKAIVFSINCLEEDMRYWKSISKGIMNSIEIS